MACTVLPSPISSEDAARLLPVQAVQPAEPDQLVGAMLMWRVMDGGLAHARLLLVDDGGERRAHLGRHLVALGHRVLEDLLRVVALLLALLALLLALLLLLLLLPMPLRAAPGTPLALASRRAAFAARRAAFASALASALASLRACRAACSCSFSARRAAFSACLRSRASRAPRCHPPSPRLRLTSTPVPTGAGAGTPPRPRRPLLPALLAAISITRLPPPLRLRAAHPRRHAARGVRALPLQRRRHRILRLGLKPRHRDLLEPLARGADPLRTARVLLARPARAGALVPGARMLDPRPQLVLHGLRHGGPRDRVEAREAAARQGGAGGGGTAGRGAVEGRGWRRVDLRHILLLEEQARQLLLTCHAQVHVHAPLRVAVRQCGAAAWPLQQEAAALQRTDVDGRQWLVGVCGTRRRAVGACGRRVRVHVCGKGRQRTACRHRAAVGVRARPPTVQHSAGLRGLKWATQFARRPRYCKKIVDYGTMSALSPLSQDGSLVETDSICASWQKRRPPLMESIEALLTQVARSGSSTPPSGLDSLISALRGWQREAEAGSSGTDALSEQVSEQGLQELVHGHHKAVSAAVSKLGKGIDKAMSSHVELPLERMPSALVAQAVLPAAAATPCHLSSPQIHHATHP